MSGNEDMRETHSGTAYVTEQSVTPVEEDSGYQNRLENSCKDEYSRSLRKSLSMNDIAAFPIDPGKEDVYESYEQPSEAPRALPRTKFVYMAEATYSFQTDAPGRPHSSRPQLFRSPGAQGRFKFTGAQSHMLRCKAFSRLQHTLSKQEKEEMEFEELKKFKIKANPIPKSVIEGSHLPEIRKKPSTFPVPFNLTQVHKKVVTTPEPGYIFKARPAPKEILEKPVIPVKVLFKKSKSLDDAKKAKPSFDSCRRHSSTKLEPFSFERRNEELRKKREERIKQQIEEERKQASQFKAQPWPRAVKKRMHCGSSSSTTSSEQKENHFKFAEKPPTVLYKEQTHTVEPVPFERITKRRAAERENFDNELKKKKEDMDSDDE